MIDFWCSFQLYDAIRSALAMSKLLGESRKLSDPWDVWLLGSKDPIDMVDILYVDGTNYMVNHILDHIPIDMIWSNEWNKTQVLNFLPSQSCWMVLSCLVQPSTPAKMRTNRSMQDVNVHPPGVKLPTIISTCSNLNTDVWSSGRENPEAQLSILLQKWITF